MKKEKLTFGIPQEYEILDIFEKKESGQSFIDVFIVRKDDMCNIKPPHVGFKYCSCYEEDPELRVKKGYYMSLSTGLTISIFLGLILGIIIYFKLK